MTLTADGDRADDNTVEWGLENPDGFVITVRTSACEDLGEQTLTDDGEWSVVVFNPTDDEGGHDCGFTVT